MYFKQFIDLGLYKSSCILFSCLFFVSCNTVAHKSTEVVSAAGTRNIASAAMTSMNASAFVAMQVCPVITSIQSMVQMGTSTEQLLTELMERKDSQGKTLIQKLVVEMSPSYGCIRHLVELKQEVCSHRVYDDICENLDKLEEMGGAEAESVKKEFESFIGTSIESLDSHELMAKTKEFITTKTSISKVGALLEEIEDKRRRKYNYQSIGIILGLLVTVGILAGIVTGSLAVGAAMAGAAAAGSVVAVGSSILIVRALGYVIHYYKVQRERFKN